MTCKPLPLAESMTYFLLGMAFKDELGLTPNVFVNVDVDEIFRMKDTLTHATFYDHAGPIPFLLDEEDGYPSRLLDINRWIKSEPEAFKLIISPSFKAVLETFRLPPHRFYDAYGYILSERTKHPLYVLHFHFDYVQEITLAETTFAERRTNARTILNRTLEKGEIAAVADFRLYTATKVPRRYWLYPDKLRFKPGTYYDVFATDDGIIVNAHVKQAIERAGLKGVELTEYTDYEILMGEAPAY